MRGEHRIDVVQLDPLKLVKSFPSDKGPHDAYTSADGSRVYVGAQFGRSIEVIDPATQTALPRIPTADGVRPIEPTRDGRTLYVALSNLLGFVVVDPATRKVTRRVELGKLPEGVPKPYLDTYTHALQLSPDEQELWVTDCINDLVRVVRLSDMQEVAKIQVGHFPHWFTMRPDGKVIFVSLWYSDAVVGDRRRQPQGDREHPVRAGRAARSASSSRARKPRPSGQQSPIVNESPIANQQSPINRQSPIPNRQWMRQQQ